jgi:YihY family inner membrane protein
MDKPESENWPSSRPGRLILNALRNFRENQGLLLAGAIAYHTLLSVVPMLILTLIVLSQFIEEYKLLQTISTHLGMIIPAYAATLTAQVEVFLEHREVIGFIGALVMLFFSSLAFTMLENSMAVIFLHRGRVQRRHFLISAVIPYIYILLLGLGLLFVSFIAGALDAYEDKPLTILGWRIMLNGTHGTSLYLLGVIGEVFMLTSIYLVMPVGRITFRHALVGGISATILWEMTRRVLVWYYSTLSLVNLIYGSLAATVVTLFSIEIAAVILLFCAQVIAELDRAAATPVGGAG